MINIRIRMLECLKKMTVKQVIACTFVETLFIIMVGIIVSVVIPEFRVLRVDFIFVVVVVNFFELLSVIKEMFFHNKNISEILYWSKFVVLSLISVFYLIILVEFRQLDELMFYFSNLKFTLILTMILILGLDLTIDKIDEIELQESNTMK